MLHAQGDVATDFGLRARMRLTSQKSFVKQDCGRRFAAAVLRKAAPLTKEYHVGDLVCFQRKQGANEPGTEWVGVARIIGFENKTCWVMRNGTPIATTIYKLRPATAAETLATEVLNRDMTWLSLIHI